MICHYLSFVTAFVSLQLRRLNDRCNLQQHADSTETRFQVYTPDVSKSAGETLDLQVSPLQLLHTPPNNHQTPGSRLYSGDKLMPGLLRFTSVVCPAASI